MPIRIALPFLLLTFLVACRPRGEAARAPGSPVPVAPTAGPGGGAPPPTPPGRTGAGGAPGSATLPGRADDAPLVRVEDALAADSLLGRRVRVTGRCTAAGAGRKAGSWTLEDSGSAIEVRGLVPSACATHSERELTIFAQIEPKATGSSDRLLLRLPD